MSRYGNFIAQLCRRTLSRDKIASLTWRVALLFNGPFSNTAVLLCRENAVNADWSILFYATKLQCAICTAAYGNFFAR